MSALITLLNKSRRQFRNTGAIIREQSMFKVIFVLCFAIVFESGLWLLFAEGFTILDAFGGISGLIIGRLLSLFFLGLGMMLVMSGAVTTYSTMFRSDEIDFLVARPVTESDIVAYKFIETIGLASWAFFFIVIPFVGAYARQEQQSVLFTFWTLLFSLPMLVLCCGIGTILVLLFVRWFPQGRKARALLAILVAGGTVAAWLLLRGQFDASQDAQFSLRRLVPGLRLAGNSLIPSYWVSEGILSLSRGQWMRGGMLWGVLLSSALVVYVIVEWMGGRVFYDCRQRVVSAGGGRRGASRVFVVLDRVLLPLPADIRAMIMKDIRIFIRDPVQWSQALIFFGLLGMYFGNLRNFNYDVLEPHWRSLMVFLNVFSVCAVMCSLGSRFVYPQLSLEGQGFWVLGLSPTTMTRIVLTKFIVSLAALMLVSVVLVLLSSFMLRIDREATTVALALVIAVSLAVCGFSTGLGAVFLDLRQRNPAAIVSGFGGTLNLVLSLAFMLAVILPFAGLFSLRAAARISVAGFRSGMLAASLWLSVASGVSTLLPLNMGIRSLGKRDY